MDATTAPKQPGYNAWPYNPLLQGQPAGGSCADTVQPLEYQAAVLKAPAQLGHQSRRSESARNLRILFAVVLLAASWRALLVTVRYRTAQRAQQLCPGDADVLCSPYSAGQHMPIIGNGYLGTVVGSEFMHVAGVYNGRGPQQWTSTHRARVPNLAAVQLSGLHPLHVTLDLKRAVFSQHSQMQQGIHVTESWYAHRARSSLLVYEASISAQAHGILDLSLERAATIASPDFIFSAPEILSLPEGDVLLIVGQTTEPEQADGQPDTVAIVTTVLPERISIPNIATNHSLLYITAIRTSVDSADPAQAALEDYAAAWVERGSLRAEHEAAWAGLWQHSVEVEGPLELMQRVRSSWYYLLSNIRADVPWSLSPGGVAADTFSGHVFWDTEVWMYPNLAVFHPDLAQSCMQYRYDRLEQAHIKANQSGYRGAMFPWESAGSGLEVTALAFDTGTLEQHISADVTLAVKWFWELTKNKTWLHETGAQLVFDVADFWVSRADCGEHEDGSQCCDINNITGPDENHAMVNNSVYTNVAAKIALEFAAHAHADILQLGPPPPAWLEVADALTILYDPELHRHHEFAGYQGDTIKQADVVLLSYPLQWPIPRDVEANNLRYYGDRTDAHGPAMTWSMATIDWLQLGETAKAAEAFDRSQWNMEGPFHLWWEIAGGAGGQHFVTGAGGWLQSLWAGYAGMRFNEDALSFHHQILPPGATSLSLEGVTYSGNVLDISYNDHNVTVQLVNASAVPEAQTWLLLGRAGVDAPVRLEEDRPVVFPLQPFAVATGATVPQTAVQGL